MGKGFQSGASELQLSAHTTRVFSRVAWTNLLRNQLDQLVEDSLLIDVEAGQGVVGAVMQSYANGEGGEEAWMSDFSAATRARLAEMLHEEHHPQGAVQMINDDSLPLDIQVKLLHQLKNDSLKPKSRSLYRQALASVFYRQMQLSLARAQLQADIDDSESTPEMKYLAETKLQALAEVEEPRGWQWRIIPPELRTGPGSDDAFSSLVNQGLRSHDGFAACKYLVPALSQAGYHREALDLASRMMEAHSHHLGHMTYAKALEAAGRIDEAIEFHLRSAAKFGSRGAEADAHYKAAQDICDLAVMPESAIEVGRIRRKHASAANFMEAHRDVLDRMIAHGDVARALVAVDGFGSYMDKEDFVRLGPDDREAFKVLILTDALRPSSVKRNKTSRSLRSLIRQKLVEELIKGDSPSSAMERLREELDDPGIASDDKAWAEAQVEWLASASPAG